MFVHILLQRFPETFGEAFFLGQFAADKILVYSLPPGKIGTGQGTLPEPPALTWVAPGRGRRTGDPGVLTQKWVMADHRGCSQTQTSVQPFQLEYRQGNKNIFYFSHVLHT